GVGNLNCQAKQDIELDGLSGDAVLQGGAFQKLHGDEGLAILLADVIDGADIWMIEGRCGLRFALKASESLGVAGNVFRQEFQRDKTLQASVFRFIDNSHAATAEFFDDAVVRDNLVNHVWIRKELAPRPTILAGGLRHFKMGAS